MQIVLKKGESLNLTKKEPTLKKVMIGLGWEFRTGYTIDLDTSLFMVNRNGKLPANEYLVFYNNLHSPDGSVQHTGDNRTGQGDDDDEIILANLPLVSPDVKEMIICVSIYDAQARRHNFGLLTDAYIRLVDVETKREILRYDLDQSFTADTDVEFGRFRLETDGWHFTASGIGSNKGLQGYVDIYV
jgi:tellurium resistance protein TerD